MLQTVYTIEPKKRVMKTSFSRRNLRGATMLEIVMVFLGVISRSNNSLGGGEKEYMKGRWMEVNRIVPLPAMLRRVSGSKSRMRRRVRALSPNKNQKIA